MFVSKSFGYALRGILYVAIMSLKGRKTVQIEEIAENLKVPKYFLGKIMNRVVKARVLDSTKGQHGGFSLNQNTLATSLSELLEVTGTGNQSSTCALGLRNCDQQRPCPLHSRIELLRTSFYHTFSNNTIRDLLSEDHEALINSIAAH